MDQMMPDRKSQLKQAVRRLRTDLGDTQQDFANRLGLAISTVVRYELTRPPRGKALAQLERVAMENGLDECALIFRNALREELGGTMLGDQIRPPAAGPEAGLECFPRTQDEEVMIFDVLQVMREAAKTGPPVNAAVQHSREEAKKEMKLLLNATKRARAVRIEALEMYQADQDQRAAIVRLHNMGMSRQEITRALKLHRTFCHTSGQRKPMVDHVLDEYAKERNERKPQ